jgi:hypothetical protein
MLRPGLGIPQSYEPPRDARRPSYDADSTCLALTGPSMDRNSCAAIIDMPD